MPIAFISSRSRSQGDFYLPNIATGFVLLYVLFVFFNQIYVFNYVPAGEKTFLTCKGRRGQGEQLLSLSPALISLPRPNHSPSACGPHVTRSILWAVTQIDSTCMFTVQRNSLLLGVCTCSTNVSSWSIFKKKIIYSLR